MVGYLLYRRLDYPRALLLQNKRAGRCQADSRVYVASTKSGDVLQIYDSVESSENVSEWAKDNFVRAVDAPGADDPNVQIRESVDICEQKRQIAIICALLDYNDLYSVSPEWTRSEYSMLIAWDMHNKIYNIMHNERCQHVDFNNGDELSRVADYYKRAVNGVIPYVFG